MFLGTGELPKRLVQRTSARTLKSELRSELDGRDHQRLRGRASDGNDF